MAFNGSGLFVRLYNWVNDAANSINIKADRMDAEMDGFAQGLSNCITRDGQGKPSAAIDWNGQNLLNVNQGAFASVSVSGNASVAGTLTTGPHSATSIDSTPIGQTTPAAGKFTTLTATGALSAASMDSTPIGQTTPAAGSFTTVSSTGHISQKSATGEVRLHNAAGNNWTSISSPKLAGDTEVDFRVVTKSGTLYMDANGNLLVGVTSNPTHTIAKAATEGADLLYVYSTSTINGAVFQAVSTQAWNAAKAAFSIGKNSSNGRSINAGGTINASGADYAEYMRKAENCGLIAKGAIVGVNADGELTDKWSEAVSFLIKSTDPSYVGGDTWGSEEALGLSRPVEPQFTPPSYDGAADPGEAPVPPAEPDEGASEEQIAAYVEALEQYQQAAADYERAKSNFEQDQAAYSAKVEIAKQIFDTATYPAYLQELATFEAALEAARQKVDRIAFSGQVPVNVKGAKPGQYVVPVQSGEGIGAILVSDAAISFEQYRRAVGIVQNILEDGRANVRVKVA